MTDNEGVSRTIKIRPAWRAFTIHFVAIAVFLFGPWLNPEAALTPFMGQVIAAALALFIVAKHYGSYYVIGIDGLLIKNLGYQPITVAFNDISQVRTRQGVIKNLLNYGNILIYSGNNEPFILYGLFCPEAIKSHIQKAAI